MAINDNITVVAGKITKPAIDVETTTTIEHASTGMYMLVKQKHKLTLITLKQEAQADIRRKFVMSFNPETSTKTEDIKRLHQIECQ
jgi:hypothetical protein